MEGFGGVVTAEFRCQISYQVRQLRSCLVAVSRLYAVPFLTARLRVTLCDLGKPCTTVCRRDRAQLVWPLFDPV